MAKVVWHFETEWSQMKTAMQDIGSEVKATAQKVDQGFSEIRSGAQNMGKMVIDSTKQMVAENKMAMAQLKSNTTAYVAETKALSVEAVALATQRVANTKANGAIMAAQIKADANIQINEARIVAREFERAAKEQTTAAVSEAKLQAASWASLQRQKRQEIKESEKAETEWAKASAQAARELAREHTLAWNKVKTTIQDVTQVAAISAAALAGIAITSAKEFMGFEAVLNRFSSRSKATIDELEDFKQKSIDLGKATIFSNTQVAEAGTKLVEMGFSASMATKALDSVVKMAVITGKPLTETATSLGVAINSLKLGAEQAKHLVDVFAAASQRGGDATAMAEAMHYLGNKIVNVSHNSEELSRNFETMSGYMVIAQKAGIQGGQFGQDMAQAITHLLAPTKKGIDVMLEYGLATKDANGHLRTFATDAQGNMKPMTEIIRILKETTTGMNDMSKAELLKKIFGVDALTAFNPILNSTQSELNEIDKAMHNTAGTSDKLATDLQKGLLNAWNQLTGSFENAKSALGESLSPTLTKLMGLIQGLFDWFVNLSQPMKDVVAESLLVGFGITTLTFIVGGLALSLNAVYTSVTNLKAGLAELSAQQVANTGVNTALTASNGMLATSITTVGGAAASTALVIGTLTLAVGAAIAIILKLIDDTNKALDTMEKAEGIASSAQQRTVGALSRSQRQGGPKDAKQAADAATEAANMRNTFNEQIKDNEQKLAAIDKKIETAKVFLKSPMHDSVAQGKIISDLATEKNILNEQLAGYKQKSENFDQLNKKLTIQTQLMKEQEKVAPAALKPEHDRPDKKAERTANKAEETAYQVALKNAETVSEAEIAAFKKVHQLKVGASEQQIQQSNKTANLMIADFDKIEHSVGQCLWGVKQLYATGQGVANPHATLLGGFNAAADAADKLVKDVRFIEITLDKTKSMASQFKKGDIAVYDRQAGFSADYGHIEVADPENKRMLSDHARQMQFWGQMEGHTRVFRLKGMAETQHIISDQTVKDMIELDKLQSFKSSQSEHLAKNPKEEAALDKQIADLKLKVGKETAAEQAKLAKQQQEADKKAATDIAKMDLDIAKDRLKQHKESLATVLENITLEAEAKRQQNQQQMENAVSVEGLSESRKLQIVQKFGELNRVEQDGFNKQKEEARYAHNQKILAIEQELASSELALQAESENKIIGLSDLRLKKIESDAKAQQHGIEENSDLWTAIETQKTALQKAEIEKRIRDVREYHNSVLEMQREGIEKRLGKTEAGKIDLEIMNQTDPMEQANAELGRLGDLKNELGIINQQYVDIQDQIDKGNLSLEERIKLTEKQIELENKGKNLVELIGYYQSGLADAENEQEDNRQKSIKSLTLAETIIKSSGSAAADLAGMFGEAAKEVVKVSANVAELGVGIAKSVQNASAGGEFDMASLFDMKNVGDTIGLIAKGVSIATTLASSIAGFFFPDQSVLEIEKQKFIANILKIDNDIFSIRLESRRKAMEARGVRDILQQLLPDKQNLLESQKEDEKRSLTQETNTQLKATGGFLGIMSASDWQKYNEIKATHAKQLLLIDEKYAQLSVDVTRDAEKEKQDIYDERQAALDKQYADSQKAAEESVAFAEKLRIEEIAEEKRHSDAMTGFDNEHHKSKIALLDNERDRARESLAADLDINLAALDAQIKLIGNTEELNAALQKRQDIIDETAKKQKELAEATQIELANSLAATQEETAALLAKAGKNTLTIEATDKSNFFSKSYRDEDEAVRQANKKYGAQYEDTQKLVSAIHAKYAAQRNGYDSDLNKKSMEDLHKIMQDKFATLKEMAKEQLDLDKQQFDEQIRQQNEIKKQLEKDVSALEKRKNAELANFDLADKTKFNSLLSQTIIDEETKRKALNTVASPDTPTPTGTASSKLMREGFDKYFNTENRNLESDLGDENITQAQYKSKKEQLILLERKFNQDQLANVAMSEDEKSKIRERNTSLYQEFQKLERQEITDTYKTQEEANRLALDNNQYTIDRAQEQIESLTKEYDDRIRLVDQTIKNTNIDLRSWIPSAADVRYSFGSLISDIISGANKAQSAIQSVSSGIQGMASATGSAASDSNVTVIGKPTQQQGFTVAGPDGRYYDTTSNMLAATRQINSGPAKVNYIPNYDIGMVVDNIRWYWDNVSQGQKDSYPVPGQKGHYANYEGRRLVEGYARGTIASGDGLRLVHDGEPILPKQWGDWLRLAAGGGRVPNQTSIVKTNHINISGNNFETGVQVEQSVLSALNRHEDQHLLANAGWFAPLS